MMRKFTICLMLYSCFLASSCEDEAENPPKSSFTVDKTSGKASDTEFVFTVDEVDADAISLLPYGTEKAGFGSVLIPKSSFTGGKATVKYKYAQVGVFQAVVVTNNHSDDGSSIKNSVSAPQTITITSNKNALSKFGLEYVKDEKTTIKSTKTTPDPLTVGAPITVTIPYGVDRTKLVATFETDPFTVVKIGTVVQESGKTVNNFTTPQIYTVVSEDGTVSTNYTVTANVVAAEQYVGVKTFNGKLISKTAKDKVIPAYADSVANIIVLYDTLGTPDNKFDSIRVSYALTGKFATMKYGTAVLKQDSLLKDIVTTSKQVTVVAEDPAFAQKTYTLYAVDAPKLTLSFQTLNPVVEGTTTNFDITLKALAQTGKSISTFHDIDLPAGVVVTTVKWNGNAFVDGTVVDYTKPVKFELTVVDANIGKTYVVTYTATLVQL